MAGLLRLIEEHVDDEVPTLGVVEEHKETPVDQPGALREQLQGRAETVAVDEVSQSVQLLQCTVPLLQQNL